jgi:uncharacterized protein
MQINVSQLLQEPVGAMRDYQVNETADIIGDDKQYKVQGECGLLHLQSSILVKCRLKTDVELSCSRCLGVFQHPLNIRFEEEYVPTVDIHSGAPLPQPEESSTFTINEHHILDLTEAVRQYAMLAVPMKPLCAAECAGLCPSCGKNLNEGECDCPRQDIDPRWSELTKLL